MLLSQMDEEGSSITGAGGNRPEKIAAVQQPSLLLLFDQGNRPSRKDIVDSISGSNRLFVSHDPYDAPPSGSHPLHRERGREDHAWLELLCDGLTFDLLGLDGGPGLVLGEIAHSFGLSESLASGAIESVGLFPGPHLAEGANSLPVVRTMAAIAMEFVERLPGCKAVLWSPARSAMSADFFRRAVGDWLAGGPFPALGLIGYQKGDRGNLESEGLAFFSGYELSISHALAEDRIAATKLAVRAVNSLVGALPPETDLPIEIDGRALMLRPDPARCLIFVEPA